MCIRDSSYSMVLQDTWLFYGTIYENITYGRPDATREEVVAAAKAARIHTYIESLPQGYDTLLIDDGTNISKGQKQLLTIARALLMRTPMLILDEATSNVDTRTEHQIQAAMRALMADKTCFVVAHRLSTCLLYTSTRLWRWPRRPPSLQDPAAMKSPSQSRAST